jgi:hypothetical protein
MLVTYVRPAISVVSLSGVCPLVPGAKMVSALAAPTNRHANAARAVPVKILRSVLISLFSPDIEIRL